MSFEKIAIITDSCADLTPKQLAAYDNIFVLPLVIRCEDGEYLDGVDITAADVYTRLQTELPKTSLPSGDSVIALLRSVVDQGYTKAIAIMLSAGLSGTYNQMRMVAEECGKDLELAVFDSVSGSLGTGAMVLQTAEYIQQGMSFAELIEIIPKLIKNTFVWFSVDTLEYLQKGGRIGRITALAGTMLNIKPILSFADNGELVNVAKVRGRKLLQPHLIQLVRDTVGSPKHFNLMVANGGAPEEGAELREKLEKAFPGYDHYYESTLDATLSVYIGPGVLGVGIQVLPD